MIRRTSLPVLLLPALVALAACGDGGGGTGTSIPSNMQITGGDNQSGAPGTTLSEPLEVKVTDDRGNGVPEFTVSFSASQGSVSPQSMDTDADGRARTTLTLPNAEATVTVTASGAGVPSVTFTAASVPEQLSFVTTALPAGRTTVAYGQAIEVVGGSGADYTFEIASGAPPAGLVLEDDGTFGGAPTATGTFQFTVRVTDGEGESISRAFTVETCAVPPDMAVGDVSVLEPSALGRCGVWLPNDEDGRYYRVGVIRTNRTGTSGGERDVKTTVSANGVTAAATGAPALFPARSARRDGPTLPGAGRLAEMAAKQAATARRHEELLREAEALVRRFGPAAVAPTRSRPAGVAGADLPDKLQIDVTNTCPGPAGQPVTAIKIAENDRMAIYQDSTQNASAASRVTEEQAAQMLAYYDAYGHGVIEAYFGGVSDIDDNGKIIVFVTPEISENVLGAVWPGDLFSSSQCPASNEAELVYIGVDEILALTDPEDDNIGFALGVVVHEAKHIASIYQRILRDEDTHPLWMEEGGAEFASLAAARDHWADDGGPGFTELLVGDHWAPPGATTADVTSGNFAVLVALVRVQAALADQPNSLIANTGNGDDVYGSGWLFLQWLGDAYGNGATDRFADAPLFAELHHRGTSSGIAGLEEVTGTAWDVLLEEFLAAAMHNGTPTEGPLPIRRYDFVSAWELFCTAIDPVDFDGSNCDRPGREPGPPGAFPWPVTTNDSGSQQHELLTSAAYEGEAGQAGFRVHDFRTNGTGLGAEVNVEVQSPASVVVVRIN